MQLEQDQVALVSSLMDMPTAAGRWILANECRDWGPF